MPDPLLYLSTGVHDYSHKLCTVCCLEQHMKSDQVIQLIGVKLIF